MALGTDLWKTGVAAGEPPSATITGMVETQAFGVTQTVFREILERQPGLLEKLGGTIHRRFIEREEAVEDVRNQQLGETSSDILSRIKEFLGSDVFRATI